MNGRWENKAIGDVAGEYSTTVGERNTKKNDCCLIRLEI